MTDKIQFYEELALNAHPALQTQFYDGWILRFANGYTKRANSVNPLYPYTLDLREKIEYCEKVYAAQGLPVVFKLTDGTDPLIDKALDEHGYKITDQDYIMSLDLQDIGSVSNDCVTIPRADEEWLKAFKQLKNFTDHESITAGMILENTRSTLICARLVKSGISVACGTLVIERGYAVLKNVVVDESQRGKGYGKEICVSLLAEAKTIGAHTAFLQVMKDNYIAVNMYERLGFMTIYSDWYRIKEA